MRKTRALVLAILAIVPLTGCLGTLVQTPTAQGRQHATMRAHLLAAPAHIDAHACTHGISEVFTFVPLWGVAVGVLTVGILVPMSTHYSCVIPSGS